MNGDWLVFLSLSLDGGLWFMRTTNGREKKSSLLVPSTVWYEEWAIHIFRYLTNEWKNQLNMVNGTIWKRLIKYSYIYANIKPIIQTTYQRYASTFHLTFFPLFDLHEPIASIRFHEKQIKTIYESIKTYVNKTINVHHPISFAFLAVFVAFFFHFTYFLCVLVFFSA